MAYQVPSNKSRFIALIVCVFFFPLGAHRFYLGKYVTAIFFILTLGRLGTWLLGYILHILLGTMHDYHELHVKRWFPPGWKRGFLASVGISLLVVGALAFSFGHARRHTETLIAKCLSRPAKTINLFSSLPDISTPIRTLRNRIEKAVSRKPERQTLPLSQKVCGETDIIHYTDDRGTSQYHRRAFNVADSTICVGVCLLLCRWLFCGDRAANLKK